MKIAYVIDYLFSVNGGTERQLHRLIQGMVARGHNVKLYVFRHTEFTRKLEWFDCPVECLEVGSLSSPKAWLKLSGFRSLLQREHVDVLHGFFNDVALVLPILTMGMNIKSFTSRRDMGIWYSPGKLAVLRAFAFSKTRLICNCTAVAELAQRKENKPPTQIDVIYNGMDPLPTGHTMDPKEVIPRWEQLQGRHKIVLVANVRPIKRIEDLILAAAHLGRSGIGLHIAVIGHISDKSYHQELLTLAASHNISDDISYVGPVSEPRALLRHFEVGVLASESEGLSNTVMEYLDAGLPVVASNVGGNPELIADNDTGCLYPVGDSVALAGHLADLLGNADRRSQVSRRALASMDRLAISRMIDRHEERYQR